MRNRRGEVAGFRRSLVPLFRARPERRVVITGLGAITPIGLGVEGLWQGLQRRASAIRCITRFDPSMFKSRIAGEVDDFSAGDHMEERRVRRLDRFSQFSVAATRMALADAGLDPLREDPDRVGAMMGTALGGVAYGEGQYRNFLSGGPRAVDPALALTVFAGAASCNIAIEFGFTGPNSTNGMSCASGAIAIGEGFRAIVRGEADLMIAGGAEAPLAPLCFGAFSIIRAMSTRNDDPGHASRPFDQERDGFVMAEGAAVLVLEERGRALARGAPVYAEVCGFGLTNDAHHMTAPRPDGRQAARAMRNALADGQVAAHEIGYINAHGSSTPLNDATETAAIKQVFGDHAYRLAFSGTKGYYGHALGASGAIEAAICALASRRGWMPPTVNLDSPDPACDLTHVTGDGLSLQPDYLLSNSFGFGGINAALLFRRAR
jgi:3-oxoacyl-[acyl-carrier-protein] synthase II